MLHGERSRLLLLQYCDLFLGEEGMDGLMAKAVALDSGDFGSTSSLLPV